MVSRERVPVGRRDLRQRGRRGTPRGLEVGARPELPLDRGYLHPGGTGGPVRDPQVEPGQRVSVGLGYFQVRQQELNCCLFFFRAA